MPTKHRRIAVIRDAELDEALSRTAPLLGEDRPAAARVHALAVRGARALLDEPDEDIDVKAWLVAKFGAEPAKASPASIIEELPDLGEFDPDDPTPATDILEEMRADRFS